MKRADYASNHRCPGCKAHFGDPCAPDCRHNTVKRVIGLLAGPTRHRGGHIDTVGIHDTTTS